MINHNLGRDVTAFTKGDPIDPVTNVRVYYGYDSNGVALYESAVADTDNGRSVEYEIKTITSSVQAKAIADNILAGLSYPVPPYTADGCPLDPSGELGDISLVNGVVSSLGAITTEFNQGMWASISSPSIPQEEDVFGYTNGTQRAVERAERTGQVNEAKIQVNADNITAQVTQINTTIEGVQESLNSNITLTAESLTATLTQYAEDQVSNHAVEQQKYIRYSSAGLELGEDSTNTKAKLTTTALEFYDPNNSKKAYIGADSNDNNIYKFFVENGHIVNQLELGDHWLLVASGSDNDNRLTFKWKA